MKQAYRDVGSACTRVGEATQTAGIFLAGLCLFFGITFAASIPKSLENRIAGITFRRTDTGARILREWPYSMSDVGAQLQAV